MNKNGLFGVLVLIAVVSAQIVMPSGAQADLKQLVKRGARISGLYDPSGITGLVGEGIEIGEEVEELVKDVRCQRECDAAQMSCLADALAEVNQCSLGCGQNGQCVANCVHTYMLYQNFCRQSHEICLGSCGLNLVQ